ncbi:YybH family protein [Nonomuraea sp. NPDC050663]|uniref:YybH family protein n=1 Tax=Nonomuraea sp. NPDC050663 TaxID=3364370 RepID=UPI00378D7764
MIADEQQIRSLIERWAEAVRCSDLAGVIKGHAHDIVMFDVPPPYKGVRGLDAYRQVWPSIFQWQAQGASFEIESMDVTVGRDLAFAYALLRCGTSEQLRRNPEMRLRLTLCLRKENDRWEVTHEHHSFPFTDVGEEEPAGHIFTAAQT